MSVVLDKEYKFYLNHLDQFIPKHRHQFVVIKDEQVAGFFKTYEDALKSGLAHYGNVPFFIKEVQKDEEVHFFSRA